MKHSLATANFIVSKAQISLDKEMVTFDIWGTTAHVLMLHHQKIINADKTKRILNALIAITDDVKKGAFEIDPDKGAQLTLESKIIEKAGKEAGYSVHTGRSRNDQIILTEMLYLREEILSLLEKITPVAQTLHMLAEKHMHTILPGYTHMQPAKVTTFGQWCLAYLYGFLRAIETLKYYYGLYDMNPLGACESYGTSWPINREYTSKLLGFSNIWEIPQDVVSSRGFIQLGYSTGLTEICLVASKLATDLLLFNTFEYNMVELGDEVAQRMHPITGSSVMAQKKNPDALELIRATAPQVSGFTSILANILDSLPMGYNRDSREVKEYIGLGLSKTESMLNALHIVLTTIKLNEKRMKTLVEMNYCLTTDLADYISQKSGIGYRIIYKIVGEVVDEAISCGKLLKDITPKEILEKAKKHQVNLYLTDEEVKRVMEPIRVIEERMHTGGSSTRSMKKSLKNAKKDIENVISWVEEQSRTIKAARKKTRTLVNALIGI
ncbi:argininosuccinate lyase [Candidatus Roizmanbacteria bacterium CG09_land_8_20_14_0_10_41_9]|uniref:Argininosuccinate lyase n=1 Tax=Candidatus Roizmanbacteria bacterium CG09_land_8_20_14_0_10_41_9 TaxID=1974850 RepID=A0A2H0WTX2_9BACT|nr:MAG: argininosuccinate lyase [Candidatus Roizmanbacteria bacterium CG09_land_8_20_14_0_10_41_9]